MSARTLKLIQDLEERMKGIPGNVPNSPDELWRHMGLTDLSESQKKRMTAVLKNWLGHKFRMFDRPTEQVWAEICEDLRRT